MSERDRYIVKTPGKRGRPRKRRVVSGAEQLVEIGQESGEEDTDEAGKMKVVVEGSTCDFNKESAGKSSLACPKIVWFK